MNSKHLSFGRVHDNAVQGLWQQLPEAVPYAIHIDPINLCNFCCPFCPTGNPELLKQVNRPSGMMDLKLYRKIIHDLTELTQHTGKKISRLHLYKDGEPLLHKNLPIMIRLAKSAHVAKSVETTTNGALLTSKLIREILDSGLDLLRVSVEHTDENVYAALSRGKTTYAQILENVQNLFSQKTDCTSPLHVHVKIVDCGLSEEQKTRFVEDFSPVSDTWNIDAVMGWSSCEIHDFKLSLDSSMGMDGVTRKKKRTVCPEPFAKLAINFDGSVSVCCVDWAHRTIVGNVALQSIHEIWYGEKLRVFRMQHLRGARSKLAGCASCDYLEGFPEYADLDDHCAELLRLFQKRSAPVGSSSPK